jgi:RNA polymerase sigma factor (sigma-70 family)
LNGGYTCKKKFFKQARPLIGGNMKNNNPTPVSKVNEQWLMNTYQLNFVSFKVYAIRIVHNEIDAENIVGQCFAKMARTIVEEPNKFSSSAHAKAFLIAVIKNDCCSWLRKKLPVITDEHAGGIMDEHQLVLELEKQDLLRHLLSLIHELPPKLQDVAILFFKEGLTTKEVEQRLHLPNEVLRVYKSRAVSKLRAMVYGGKNTTQQDPIGSNVLTAFIKCLP